MKRYARAKDIRIAVVGYGAAYNMGRRHLQDAHRAGMTPAAVADPDAARLRAAQADFPGISTYPTVEAMLKRSDANLAVIITPHNTHTRLALQCLRAGRHVICEKPMAVTTADCDAMIREAEKRKLMLSAYHNRHWDGCILQAVRTIGRGAIGAIVRVQIRAGGYGRPGPSWRSSKSISGGILYDMGAHYLEYALQLIRSELVEVSGVAHNGVWAPRSPWKSDTNEDDAVVTARFRNGVLLTLSFSRIDPTSGHRLFEILGTKGAYLFDHQEWELVAPAGSEVRVRRGRNPEAAWDRYYRNVADHLVRGADLVITSRWARRPIHILDLAGRSAREGKTLRAKYG